MVEGRDLAGKAWQEGGWPLRAPLLPPDTSSTTLSSGHQRGQSGRRHKCASLPLKSTSYNSRIRVTRTWGSVWGKVCGFLHGYVISTHANWNHLPRLTRSHKPDIQSNITVFLVNHCAVHPQMNGSTKWGTHTQWDVIRPQKGRRARCRLAHGQASRPL